ncbi:hypothetical protein CZ787_12975 [Halomonas citrativorans]|uniref:Uncharacterized protein n=1 Tax=Halomonas citrativorans TaxID=2742612 RepID=A0A1R4I2I7_9GAMM|nr:hypothetical protein CZ787_12975 [Halomonas citrativorans]
MTVSALSASYGVLRSVLGAGGSRKVTCIRHPKIAEKEVNWVLEENVLH